MMKRDMMKYKEKLIKIRVKEDGNVVLLGKSETPEQTWDFTCLNLATCLREVFEKIEDYKIYN